MNIPITAIRIISVIAGSTIVATEITAFEMDGKKYTLSAIAEQMTETEACKRLVEFGVFLAEFGDPTVSDEFKPVKQKLVMNPKYNRFYLENANDHTSLYFTWQGTLNDRKAEPYYCPFGWKKYACRVEDTTEAFSANYRNWPVVYHGTKFSLSMMISFSGLRAANGEFGSGVYFSPCIEYSAHPRYASPKKMSANAKEYAGKWVQVIFNCRVKPNSYTKHRMTIGDRSQKVHKDYDNDELEWLIKAPHGTYLDESKVRFCGYMIRTSDCDPAQLPESKWWNMNAYRGCGGWPWYE